MERHCDLCDLPFGQCAHGLAARQRGASRTSAGSLAKTKPPSKTRKERQLSAKQKARLPVVLQGVKVVKVNPTEGATKRPGCVTCGQRRFGRYNVCADCLKKQGGRECVRCGRLFRPKGSSQDARKCGTCNGKAAYTVAIMGAPGLGKRA